MKRISILLIVSLVVTVISVAVAYARSPDRLPETELWIEADTDGDGRINMIDTDWDGDGVLNVDDNCPKAANPGQADADIDEIGNECDNCPYNYNPEQEIEACEVEVLDPGAGSGDPGDDVDSDSGDADPDADPTLDTPDFTAGFHGGSCALAQTGDSLNPFGILLIAVGLLQIVTIRRKK